MIRGAIAVDLPFDLIQEARLAHALAEAGFAVHVRPDLAPRLSMLGDVFGVTIVPDTNGTARLRDVVVDHESPWTSVGRVRRPLVFPHAIVERCRAAWRAERDVAFSFSGLMTPAREAALGAWRDRWKLDDSRVRVEPSVRGRKFPVKIWDEEYVRLLARSQFVLCPRGDYVWTYRFFEAVLCGAIPVVEASCPAYEGFRYASMDDPPDSLTWDAGTAERNFALARERLTVPTAELVQEIERLLERSRS